MRLIPRIQLWGIDAGKNKDDVLQIDVVYPQPRIATPQPSVDLQDSKDSWFLFRLVFFWPPFSGAKGADIMLVTV